MKYDLASCDDPHPTQKWWCGLIVNHEGWHKVFDSHGDELGSWRDEAQIPFYTGRGVAQMADNPTFARAEHSEASTKPPATTQGN